MTICPRCHNPVLDDRAQFCPHDGTPLYATPDDPLVGHILGDRYRLGERLGQGGMGTVYCARHLFMDKDVAVKVLRRELAHDEEAASRFLREARSASRLDHEHCIRVTDFGEINDYKPERLFFLVMELLVGESLGKVVRRGRIPPARASAFALCIARALSHAHEQGVIHRDLKPDNVFLQRRRDHEIVKVLDFGLAKIVGDLSSVSSITRAGVVFGTPEYMAPEQAQSNPVDERIDIYSLGVILYQLLTGDLPFRAPNFLALLGKHVNEPPEPPSRRCPEADISPRLEEVVLRCLAKEPQRRYASAELLAVDLVAEAEPLLSGGLLPLLAGEGVIPRSEHCIGPAATGSSHPGSAAAVSTVAWHAGGDATPVLPATRAESVVPQDAVAAASSSALEIEGIPRHRGMRNLGIVLGVIAVASGVASLVLFLRQRQLPPPVAAATVQTPSPAPTRPPPPPRMVARQLLNAGDADGAARILEHERVVHDDSPLQLLLGDVALRQGNRLSALAHYHRARHLAPQDAEPHARLATLLAQMGQVEYACHEAAVALAINPQDAVARGAMKTANCKEVR